MSLTEFQEEKIKWLVPGWIPAGQVVLMAADGGVGKTSSWCNIVAAISSGKRCILDPYDYTREPGLCVYFSSEDSTTYVLKEKLRKSGANVANIRTVQKMDTLRTLKFGTDALANMIRQAKPTLVVFDPVQGFTPPDINMGSRNAMRDCLAPLAALGEELGTTFLIICHTNKRMNAYGRDRIADSADLWDISRSVIMAGFTDEDGTRYLSNEKNSYGAYQDTVLFAINDEGIVERTGTTWKRDRDFQSAKQTATGKPKLEECKQWIFNEVTMASGRMRAKELNDRAVTEGFSKHTFDRAKTALVNDGMIDMEVTGSARNKNREWWIYIPTDGNMVKLPDQTPVPQQWGP